MTERIKEEYEISERLKEIDRIDAMVASGLITLKEKYEYLAALYAVRQ